MGIFSLFQKRTPEDVYDELAHQIVHSALNYRTTLDTSSSSQATYAGTEVAFFLLHILDRHAFQMLGPIVRDKVVDGVTVRVVSRYCNSVFKKSAAQNATDKFTRQMFKNFADRQALYSKCSSVFPEDMFAFKGTVIFALSFYIHRELGLTNRDDVDDILCGKRNLADSDMHDFPLIDRILIAATYFGNVLTSWQLNKSLECLK